MGENVTNLRSNQNRAIEKLLETGQVKEAASAAGVTSKTIYAWLKQPDFKTTLAEAEAEALSSLARSMAVNAQKAAQALLDVLDDAEASHGNKISAAKVYLSALPNLRLLGSIEAQLIELREMQQNDSVQNRANAQ